MNDELKEARYQFGRGRADKALRKAWESATTAGMARDADTIDEVQVLASQIEELAGREREDAHRLVEYCAAYAADIRAGVPHDSTMSRLFRRR